MAQKAPTAPKTAAGFADITLPDFEGNEVRLGELWEDGPVVLVFLRHYGWVHCRKFALQLQRAREDIEGTGARLVLIGQATPRHASHFRERYAKGLYILADEKRESYVEAGAIRGGVTNLVNPRTVLKGIARGASSGIVQGRPVGDVAQLGGTMIVMPDGSIPWAHMSRDASDNASIDEILEAVAAAR